MRFQKSNWTEVDDCYVMLIFVELIESYVVRR